MNEKANKKPVDSRSKIDALFAQSPGSVRIRSTDDTAYVGKLDAAQVGEFLKASQKDAFAALGLADAKTLKRSKGQFDLAGNRSTVTQNALAE